MSTSVVLALFTAVSVAAIVAIMGAAVWARARSNREDLEPAPEHGSHGDLFSDDSEPHYSANQYDLVDARDGR